MKISMKVTVVCDKKYKFFCYKYPPQDTGIDALKIGSIPDFL